MLALPDLSGEACVLAAVSGGSDSTALLLLLKDHVAERHPGTRLVAATVDHGLRADARAEANAVARLCAMLAIPHRILAWTGPKPSSGIAAAARRARYNLLAEAAAEADSRLILTGHTADDQAETVAMRLARGGGPGLAGMAQVTLHGSGAWIVRPLLTASREALRAFLHDRGIGWADDPTNTDPRFERSRQRESLATDGGAASIARLLSIAGATALQRRAEMAAAAAVLAEGRTVLPGLVRIPHTPPDHPDASATLLAFRLAAAAIGGMTHLADMEAATAVLWPEDAAPGRRATLSRSLIQRRGGSVWLCREGRGLPTLTLQSGDVWDRRFRLAGPPQATVDVAPARTENARARAFEGAVAAPPVLLRQAALSRPSFAATQAAGWTATPLVAPYAEFLPAFDLDAARALAVLVGAPSLPAPPRPDHIRSAA
jgi:tRNA(Ile)-lysidine synthase